MFDYALSAKRLPFRAVLMDSWSAAKALMLHIECEKAVDEILASGEANQTQIDEKENSEDQKAGKGRLRIVPTEPKKPLTMDPEMKAIIEKMKQLRTNTKPVISDEPDAA